MLAGGESIVITVRQSDCCSARSSRIRPLRFKYNESYILFKKCSANSISYRNSGGLQSGSESTRDFSSFSLSSSPARRKKQRASYKTISSSHNPPAHSLKRATPDLSLFRFSDGPCAFNPFRASFYLRRPAICAPLYFANQTCPSVCLLSRFCGGNLERTAAGAVATDCVYEIETLARSSCIHL